MRARQTAKDIDDYIARFPAAVQETLEAIRRTIRTEVPDAEETISYQIPTFTLNGKPVIYFAGYKSHVGVYPAPVGNPAFKSDLTPYASGKGTVRFPLNEPIPFSLLRKIVKFRVQETLGRASAKGRKS